MMMTTTTMSEVHNEREFLIRVERKRDRGTIVIRSFNRSMPRGKTGDGAGDKREGGRRGKS